MSKHTNTTASKKEAKAANKAAEQTANKTEAEAAEDEEEEATGKMAKTLSKYRPKYVSATSYNGRKSARCGDELSAKLEGLTPKEVLRLAEKVLKLEPGELQNRYASLNPGQQRMNGGNRIRAAIKRQDITIADIAKALPKPAPMPTATK